MQQDVLRFGRLSAKRSVHHIVTVEAGQNLGTRLGGVGQQILQRIAECSGHKKRHGLGENVSGSPNLRSHAPSTCEFMQFPFLVFVLDLCSSAVQPKIESLV